jgi:hypothetical protein
MSNVKFHTPKNAVWVNAAGDNVPVKFVPKSDKLKESLSSQIYKTALKAEGILNELHLQMSNAMIEVRKAVMNEYEVTNGKKKKEGKGSFTWFNFDKSLKVEADMNEIVKWDSAMMTQALELLNNYLSKNLTEENMLIGDLVKSAFANSKGQIDTGKVFQILRFESKIKDKNFIKACEIMKNAQSIDRTKLYQRVWEKQEDGSYRNINLNFSSL